MLNDMGSFSERPLDFFFVPHSGVKVGNLFGKFVIPLYSDRGREQLLVDCLIGVEFLPHVFCDEGRYRGKQKQDGGQHLVQGPHCGKFFFL